MFTDNGTTILRFRTGKIPRAAIPGAGVKHSKETQKAHCHFLLDVRHLFLNRVFKFFLLSPKISATRDWHHADIAHFMLEPKSTVRYRVIAV